MIEAKFMKSRITAYNVCKSAVIPLLGLASFCSTVLAVDPPPDGGYFMENTAEGEDALFSLTNGLGDTAVGYRALYNNTSGLDNTAVGDQALFSNITGGGNSCLGARSLFANTTGN